MTFDSIGATTRFVLDPSLRALSAAVAVALVLKLLRVRSPAVLHAAWTAVLVSMLLMPVLPYLVPTLPVPVPAGAGRVLGWRPNADESFPAVAVNATTSVRAENAASSPGEVVPVHARDSAPASVNGARALTSWLQPASIAVYAAGAILLLARLFYGLAGAAALTARAKRNGSLELGASPPVYQSPEVTAPMTVGVIRPVIVLPITWTTWDGDMLAAIIAHEAAHVRRHDAAINFAAHLNRAIFWFHPLAWWLQRKLAAVAEHACDQTAARALGDPRRYAGFLVAMANLVRCSRGRLAWHGAGVNGTGLLEDRVDRLLNEDVFERASRGKTFAVAAGCILAIASVIACGPQLSAPPLRADPELAKRLLAGEEHAKAFEAARDMSQAQADLLEERVTANPEDFDTRRQLVTYYSTSTRVAWDKKLAGLRRHALWLIEHRPEHDVPAPPLSPRFDPAGFAAAKELWEAHLVKPDASPFLVHRAASFFAPQDKPYAEQLILRGMAMDPDSAALRRRMPAGVGGYEWPIRLAALYAAALRGSEGVSGTDHDLRTHLDKVNSAYAVEVRRKLSETRDAKLLARIGETLTRPLRQTKDPALRQALEQVRALGIRYLERALEIDPALDRAKAALVRLRLREQATDADRLGNRALEGYLIAEDITEYAQKDLAAGKQQRDEARGRAEEVLKRAAAHAQDPAYSAAVMTAHHVLAMAALRDGDRERAAYHMVESVKVPTSERIQYEPPFSWIRPVNRLLREGERERVVQFLEALARLTITERDRLLEDAQAIRNGRMPASYQHTVTREGR
jgi:beta-lactamase regulating signal transducer with metallopeptidase domain